ncbi:MAG TPA: PEP/pyruvate-binding domain-containing protein [Cellvibrionaceae bacterium]
MSHPRLFGLMSLCLLLSACGGPGENEDARKLWINEVVTSNDGVAIDENGQTSDLIELINNSGRSLALKNYAIADDEGVFAILPDENLAPGAVIRLWADADAKLGAYHLPFKLSASGETLKLRDDKGVIYQQIKVPELATNDSYSRFPSGTGEFSTCRYATPNRSNGERCQANSAPPLKETVTYKPFDQALWPSLTPASLGLNELALLPAQFVEVKNFSQQTLQLSNYQLILAAYPPDAALPSFNRAGAVNLPAVSLAPGAVFNVPINATQVQAITQQAFNEGVAVLYDRSTQKVIDQVPFMHWPQQHSLARQEQYPYRLRFCDNPTPNVDGQCQETQRREIGNRTRGLYTPGDFAQLAAGSGLNQIQSVKFVMDLARQNAVHFLGSREWPLHYTFVREVIDGDPRLNRCDDNEYRLFINGWSQFSYENYFDADVRRYHLGTLTFFPNADLSSVEFTFGDEIRATQMRDAFYTVTAATSDPFAWVLRPQDATQVERVRSVEGTLPIVGPQAPFANVVFQGLAQGVAFGTLTYIPTEELTSSTLGERKIVITNDVPNDIDFVGGLITETFQTPLAHVNILSQSRNTPNMALPNAHQLPEIKTLLGRLVRLEVNDGGYSIRAAEQAEAEAFWTRSDPDEQKLIPRLDAQFNTLLDLKNASIADLPRIGAKAAQMAELIKVNIRNTQCSEGGAFALPEGAFAVPMAFYLNHLRASGAQTLLDGLLRNNQFLTDLAYRKNALANLQQKILTYPVDPALLTEINSWAKTRFGKKTMRFRSSSNTEDLAEFNGAGLYESLSAKLDSPEESVEIALRTVWASLWNLRAFEERENAHVEQSQVAMAVLVHRSFPDERANGVAVGRNVLDVTRTDQFYFNIQAGEASVTNPAPGVATEELIYQWPPRTPTLTYQSYSSLLPDQRVITPAETRALACAVDAIQKHFRTVLDPNLQDRWFTIETEFKFLGVERQLLIKQARPYKMPALDIPNDCREIE